MSAIVASNPSSRIQRVLTLAGIIGMIAVILFIFTPPRSAMADCKPDGVPAIAGSGVTGAIDAKTDKPSGGNHYGESGWAGLRWYTCDIGNTVVTRDNTALVDTWMGSQLLAFASLEGSVMTAMHKWTADPQSFLKPIDDKVAAMSEVTKTVIFDEWAYPVIIIAGVAAAVGAVTRKIRPAIVTVGVTLLALAFVSLISTAPLTVAQSTDGIASSIVSAADAKTLQYAGIPTADDAKAATKNGGAPKLGASDAEATGAVLNDAMIAPMWRLGEVGTTSNSLTTEKLWDASVATWDEARGKNFDPDKKKDDYNDAVNKIKDGETTKQQYTVIKGQAYNRTGAGFIAVVEMTSVALLRIPAEGLVFLGMLVVRFVPIFGPLFALLAIPEATRGAATAGLKVVAASIFNVVVFGVIAAVHTALVAVLYVGSANSGGNIFIATVLSILATIFLLKISKPYRSVTRLATGAAVSQQLDGIGEGPGKLGKAALGFVTGAAESYVGNRGADLKEPKAEQKERDNTVRETEAGHPGPDGDSAPTNAQIHPAWLEAPAINPAWSDQPAVAPNWAAKPPINGDWAQSPDVDGARADEPAQGTDAIQDAGETWPAEWDEPMVFTPEQSDLSGADDDASWSPDASTPLIEPEFEGGHMVSTIFVAPDEADAGALAPNHDVTVNVDVDNGNGALSSPFVVPDTEVD